MSDSHVPIRVSEMTFFARARTGAASTIGEPCGTPRASMPPTSELGLISLVVAALIAAAAIVSFAALGRQAPYANVTGAVGAHVGADAAMGATYGEVAVVDRAPCLDPGCGAGSHK
jgi:hypothetical protein